MACLCSGKISAIEMMIACLDEFAQTCRNKSIEKSEAIIATIGGSYAMIEGFYATVAVKMMEQR
jgi:hypothetical protein